MGNDSASGLVAICAARIANGADFPTVWQRILKGHALIAGPPVSAIRDGRARLEINLITGQRLVFDSTSKEFSLE